MLGLETALALALTELDLPIEDVLALMSWRPAAIAGIGGAHGGPIAPGVSREPVRDRSRRDVDCRAVVARQPQPQHPVRGRTLTGRVRHTMLFGEPVVIDGEAQR